MSKPWTVTEEKISKAFPHALTNDEVVHWVGDSLKDLDGFDETTLLATSLCCDEVARALEKDLSALYGDHFNMGGLAGFAFGGVTSFGAMAHHIPDGGSCLVVYGPHVGVDAKGAVGTVDRRGRFKGGACCGSAVAAAAHVAKEYKAGKINAKKDGNATPVDAQQAFVGNMLMPYAERLDTAKDANVELPYALFDAQKEMMERIVRRGCNAVEGRIALLGGIQINTPADQPDYFMPLTFDLWNNKGVVVDQLLESAENYQRRLHVETPTVKKVHSAFPRAVKNADVVAAVSEVLKTHHNYDDKALLATSLCCDEVARSLEKDFVSVYGDHFTMGGLAGFAFGGVTSFGAMAHHIPDGGSCLIVYGPHVGVDDAGNVGTVNRRGRVKGGACCGSAVAAAAHVAKTLKEQGDKPKPSPKKNKKNDQSDAAAPDVPVDVQQEMVGKMLMPHGTRLKDAEDSDVELPFALFDAQHELMLRIVGRGKSAVAGSGKIALLGGIQINTPDFESDYFMPMSFMITDNKTNDMKNIENQLWEACIRQARKNGKQTVASSKIATAFPKAMPNLDLVEKTSKTLAKYGYGSKSLLATSLCCDEVARSLEKDFSQKYGESFSMGGLAGFPFGGVTSFGAMAHHIPDGGSCLVVYGPHVGVDSSGTVGTVNRRGRAKGGACCGSAVAAAGQVAGLHKSAVEQQKQAQAKLLDSQQAMIESVLMCHAKRLSEANDKNKAKDLDVELPQILYQAQAEMMQQLIQKTRPAFTQRGKLAVLGGIQIHTPASLPDYFLPLSFDLYTNIGGPKENLLNKLSDAHAQIQVTCATILKIFSTFPKAFTTDHLVSSVSKMLEGLGYTPETSVLATSFCGVNPNRSLSQAFEQLYGDAFVMGGLAGFPFGGVTSMGILAKHMPRGSNCLVVFGPHVGIDSTGLVGTMDLAPVSGKRLLDPSSVPCFVNAKLAAERVLALNGNKKDDTNTVEPSLVTVMDDNTLDAQQNFIAEMLLPHADRIVNVEDPNVDLMHVLFDAQKSMMHDIVEKGSMVNDKKKAFRITMLGGIQINTPEGHDDFFLPLSFKMLDTKEKEIKSMEHLVWAAKNRNAQNAHLGKATEENIFAAFPGAFSNADLVSTISQLLIKYGYDESTLLATSLCCCEVTRTLEKQLSGVFGDQFSMGGLAGFPFGGVSAVRSMVEHFIPNNGTCLVVYGPHVGVDESGAVGTLYEIGQRSGGPCCPSAIAAAEYVTRVCKSGKQPSALDAQQNFVQSMLLPYAERMAKAEEPQVELPFALFESQKKMMKRIITKGRAAVPAGGKVALLGGIQINTPVTESDYFLPLSFELCDEDGNVIDLDAEETQTKMQNTKIQAKKQQQQEALYQAAESAGGWSFLHEVALGIACFTFLHSLYLGMLCLAMLLVWNGRFFVRRCFSSRP